MVKMRVGPATNSLPLISRSLNQEFPVYGALASRTLDPASQPDSEARRISASRHKGSFHNRSLRECPRLRALVLPPRPKKSTSLIPLIVLFTRPSSRTDRAHSARGELRD